MGTSSSAPQRHSVHVLYHDIYIWPLCSTLNHVKSFGCLGIIPGVDTMSPVSRLVQSTSGVPLPNNVVCSYAHEKDCTVLMQMRVAVLTDTEPCYVHSSHPLAVLHSLLWQPPGGLHSLES